MSVSIRALIDIVMVNKDLLLFHGCKSVGQKSDTKNLGTTNSIYILVLTGFWESGN